MRDLLYEASARWSDGLAMGCEVEEGAPNNERGRPEARDTDAGMDVSEMLISEKSRSRWKG